MYGREASERKRLPRLGMGGREAIRRLAQLDPKVKAIVSSGYSTDPIMSDFRSFGFRGVIGKPYRLEELSEALQAMMSGCP